MATNFFPLGYHFEEFRSQVAIGKKKLISRPEYGNFAKETVALITEFPFTFVLQYRAERQRERRKLSN